MANDTTIETFDRAGEDKFLMERAEAEFLKKHLHDQAMKSVALQKKKYGKQKFIDMGKRSGESKRRKKLGLKTGNELDVVLK